MLACRPQTTSWEYYRHNPSKHVSLWSSIVTIALDGCKNTYGSCMLVAGPIWSGKTSFVIRMLDSAHILFDTLPSFVYWFYGQKTAQYDLLTKKNYIMHEGLPENFDFCESNSVIVLDDLMEKSKDSIAVTALYTKAAHHRPYFVINILQNLYFQSKQQRSRHLNTQYMVIF